MVSTYEEYQQLSASEKIGLVQVEAAKRLMGWEVHSGSVYKLAFNDSPVIVEITEDGTSLTEAGSLAGIVAGQWFFDRDTNIVYVETTGSANPNGVFVTSTFRLFFANVPVHAPHDLSTGFDVDWLPLYRGRSEFDVEIDNTPNGLGTSIEGDSSLSFYNDKDYWAPIYEKNVFENKKVFVYSWNRQLPITEAKIVFKGRIQEKRWSSSSVSFRVKDLINEFRGTLDLPTLSEFSELNVRIPEGLEGSLQRRVYGLARGHRPITISDVPQSGFSFSVALNGAASATQITKGGTIAPFLAPGMRFQVAGLSSGRTFTVVGVQESPAAVNIEESLTQAEQDELNLGFTRNALVSSVSVPSGRFNTFWLVAGHRCSEPQQTISRVIGPNEYLVTSTQSYNVGDEVVVGSASLNTIQSLRDGNKIKLSSKPDTTITEGFTTITRPAAQKVYLNDKLLTRFTDYTTSVGGGGGGTTITLKDEALFRKGTPRTLSGTLTYTSGSRIVSGAGTLFTGELAQGDWVQLANGDYGEVLQVDSDTQFVVDNTGGAGNPADNRVYKTIGFDRVNDVLSCEVYGTTADDTATGELLLTAPAITRDLLKKVGLENDIVDSTFDEAEDIVYMKVGIVEPQLYGARTTRPVREIISDLNRSVMSVIVQNSDFGLEYKTIRPQRLSTLLSVDKSEILDFSVSTDVTKLVKDVSLEFANKEFDEIRKIQSAEVVNSTSENAEYLVGTKNTLNINTFLIDEADAQNFADRWRQVTEFVRNIVSVSMKLQAARKTLTEEALVDSPEMFERLVGDKRFVGLIQTAAKSIFGSELTLDDLSGSFEKIGVWAESSHPNFSSSSDLQKIFAGYWTDEYGMIDNDGDTFGLNSYW